MWSLIIAGVLTLSGCGSSPSNNTPVTPPQPTQPTEQQLPVVPSNRRNKLYFGYFGASDEQVNEVADHVNMWFEPCWGGVNVGISHMQKIKLPTIFVIDYALWTNTSPRTYVGSEKAKQQLRDTFNKLKAADVLKYVIALYPIDEPDLKETNISANDLLIANMDIREVAAEYSELKNVPLCVTYCGWSDYRAIEDFDWVGFDDYPARENIFTNGQYSQLKAKLKPSQKITLFPGGAAPWMQDPKPFYRKAIEDDQVIAIIPFIWLDEWAGTTNKGIRTVCAPSYREIGKLIKGS